MRGGTIAGTLLAMGEVRPPETEPRSRQLVARHSDTLRDRVAAARTLGRMADAAAGSEPGHSQHVAGVALRLCLALGLGAEPRLATYLGALARDAGMVVLDGRLLRQAGPFTDEEWGLVQVHPDAGAAIVRGTAGLECAALAVLHHHERWDGCGYPDGLLAMTNPLPARIVGVADAYVALLRPRPYRDPVGPDEAMDEIAAGAATQFDPAVVTALHRLHTQRLLQVSSR
jgi:HD-GYP domain-containing protein (c-di-GMP phosphodiesterase class II)